MDCIFCKIINGEIPSYTIYEDDYVKAFLDVNPVSDGHTLIIPKKHFENIFDMDSETLTHIEIASQKVAKILKEKLNIQGITRMQNNGLGQDVKHYHMHLIPRRENDKISIVHENSVEDVKEIFEILKKL